MVFFPGRVNTNLWARWDDRGGWAALTSELTALRFSFGPISESTSSKGMLGGEPGLIRLHLKAGKLSEQHLKKQKPVTWPWCTRTAVVVGKGCAFHASLLHAAATGAEHLRDVTLTLALFLVPVHLLCVSKCLFFQEPHTTCSRRRSENKTCAYFHVFSYCYQSEKIIDMLLSAHSTSARIPSSSSAVKVREHE